MPVLQTLWWPLRCASQTPFKKGLAVPAAGTAQSGQPPAVGSFGVCTPSPGSPHPVTDRSSCGKARPFQLNTEQLRGPFSFQSDALQTLSSPRRPSPTPPACPVLPRPPGLPCRRAPLSGGSLTLPSGEPLLACLFTSHRAIIGTMAFFLPTFLLRKLLGQLRGSSPWGR